MMMTHTQPSEINRLSRTTKNRMAALGVLMSFIVCVALARFGLVDFGGPLMISCITSACVASVALLSNRTTYLPFLGEAVFPGTLLKDAFEPGDATIEVKVRAQPGATHVAYWASDVGQGIKKNPWIAYGQYTNSGVAKVNSVGMATLRLRCPVRYTVRGKVLPRHVHYRSVYPSGIVDKVETRGVVCV
jgi:hypothetical protein